MASKAKQLAKAEPYKFFLGSVCRDSYEHAVEENIAEANYLRGMGSIDRKRKKGEPTFIEENLQDLRTGNCHVLKTMRFISKYYEAQASCDLLLHADVNAFKQNAYVAAKLKDLSCEHAYESPYSYFLSILSDSPDLYQFLLNVNERWQGTSYNASSERCIDISYLDKNILLALAGDWPQLKSRAERFLAQPKKLDYKNDYIQIPQHQFLLALSTGDVPGMEQAMHAMLEYKFAKKTVYASGTVMFEFFLQYEAAMCGKIASYHGYNLDVDSAIAPKELMIYRPLEHYEDPYDFMKEFDYNDQQGWIDRWNEHMAQGRAAAEAKKKRGIFSWFRR